MCTAAVAVPWREQADQPIQQLPLYADQIEPAPRTGQTA
jgi:hypothetical protein